MIAPTCPTLLGARPRLEVEPARTVVQDLRVPQLPDLTHKVTLDVYEQYALNQAFQLNLALKQAAAGGGGGHSHAGHSHD